MPKAALARRLGESTIVNEKQPSEHHSNTLRVLLGVLSGALAGALAMLLLAPKSGEDARAKIQEKGIDLRDRTTGIMQDAMWQIRLDRSKIPMGTHQTPQDFLHEGQVLVARRLDHVSGVQ
jgi:hypothetical protein